MKPIRVLLTENHTLVRAGIRALLQGLPEIEVVAEAGDGREALRLIALHQPDVVLMDISMPDMNGLEATAQVVKEFPQVRVIILSMHANEEYVWEALKSGASGYVLKDSGISELEIALRAVVRNETFLSPAVSKYVVADYLRRAGSETSKSKTETPAKPQLTPRQREILQLIAQGLSTKAIADKLYISVKTVETHRTQLMERLSIYDIPGLVRYAIRTGLVTPE